MLSDMDTALTEAYASLERNNAELSGRLRVAGQRANEAKREALVRDLARERLELEYAAWQRAVADSRLKCAKASETVEQLVQAETATDVESAALRADNEGLHLEACDAEVAAEVARATLPDLQRRVEIERRVVSRIAVADGDLRAYLETRSTQLPQSLIDLANSHVDPSVPPGTPLITVPGASKKAAAGWDQGELAEEEARELLLKLTQAASTSRQVSPDPRPRLSPRSASPQRGGSLSSW
jgi:hypothetical protein